MLHAHALTKIARHEQYLSMNVKWFRAISCSVFLLLLPALAFAWEPYKGTTMTARVIAVTPGNTLSVKSGGRELALTFYGIGIPTERQPFGKEAHNLLNSILPPGEKCIVTAVNSNEEGLISALVQVQDRSVNNRLVSEGLGWVDRFTCKAFFCRRWHIEEHIAQKARRGVWSINVSTPPWQWGETRN